MAGRIRASFVRAFGFARRELIGIFRQPRLLVTLIIAPFAILLIFGLGYRTTPPPFQTLLVLPDDDAELDGEFFDESFGDSIDLVGTTSDATEARSRLRSGDVDLLVIAPPDPIATLEEGESAEFVVVHSEVDPVLRTSISLLVRLSVEELNRLVLQDLIAQGQTQISEQEESIQLLRDEADTLVEAIESGDEAAERESRSAMEEELERLEAETSASNRFYSSVSQTFGGGDRNIFEDLRSGLAATENPDDAGEQATQFQEDIDAIATRVLDFNDLDPELLVSPFDADVEDIAEVPSRAALSYAPGVVVVLVQHLSITFAALSLVRERELGLPAVFRVSPLGPGAILTGKLSAFLLMSAVVGGALTAATAAFGVGINGNVADYAIVLALLIISSIGLGFVISWLAKTNAQAVQYTMMVLLVSIFFTGMVLPLEQLLEPVRVISYMLPATYGIQALQDVMFRALRPSVLVVGGLAAYALVAVLASWLVMRRHVKGPAR